MATLTSRRFRLRACSVCRGDAYLDLSDEPEWRCLQCGRVVSVEATPDRLAVTGPAQQAA
jgi:PHP family Zn ribbon phosphoesterase